MISISALSLMVYIALGLSCITPIVLLSLLWRDWKQKNLW